MMTGISGRGRSGRGLALRRRTPMGDARYDALLSVDDRHILGIDSQDVESLLIDVMNLGDSAIRGSSRDTGIARREQEDTPSLRPANLGASSGWTCRHRSLHDGDRSDHGRIAYGAPCDQHRATHCERPNFEHERAPLSWLMVFAAESPRARQRSGVVTHDRTSAVELLFTMSTHGSAPGSTLTTGYCRNHDCAMGQSVNPVWTFGQIRAASRHRAGRLGRGVLELKDDGQIQRAAGTP